MYTLFRSGWLLESMTEKVPLQLPSPHELKYCCFLLYCVLFIIVIRVALIRWRNKLFVSVSKGFSSFRNNLYFSMSLVLSSFAWLKIFFRNHTLQYLPTPGGYFSIDLSAIFWRFKIREWNTTEKKNIQSNLVRWFNNTTVFSCLFIASPVTITFVPWIFSEM